MGILLCALLVVSPAGLSASPLPEAGSGGVAVEGISVGEPVIVEPLSAKEQAPDWDGIWRDVGILAGAQVGAAAVLFALPESVSQWTSEDKKSTFSDYADNFTKPGFDNDEFYINYLLHP
ncbi:MAG: hypothetical protein AB7J94_08535, partial [Geobacter sp.]